MALDEDQTGDVASAMEPDDTSAALGGAGGGMMDISQYDPAQTVAGTAGASPAPAAPQKDPRDDPRLIKLQEEGINLRQDAVENAKRMVSSMEQDRQNRPPPPQLQSVPKAPEAKLGEGAREWMMVASLLGALAGTRARGSTTAALNAFSGAIQGFHDGKLEQFKTQSQEWKQASDQVISDNQEKLQQYRALLEDNKMNLDQKMEEYKIVAGIYGDQISYNLADQRNYTLLGQNYQKDVQNTLRIAQATENLNKTRQQMVDRAEKVKETKETQDQLAKDLSENRIAPDQISARGDKNTIFAIASKKYGVNVREKESKWDVIKAEIKTLNGVTLNRQISLDQSFHQEFERVLQAHDQLKFTGYPDVNKVQLQTWARTEGDKPRGQAAAAYLTGVANLQELMASAYRQGYAPTESSFALAKEAIDKGWTSGQLIKSFKVAQDMLDIRVHSIKDIDVLGPGTARDYIGGAPQQTAPQTAPSNDNTGWGNLQVK
jgi:hypothetical protein